MNKKLLFLIMTTMVIFACRTTDTIAHFQATATIQPIRTITPTKTPRPISTPTPVFTATDTPLPPSVPSQTPTTIVRRAPTFTRTVSLPTAIIPTPLPQVKNGEGQFISLDPGKSFWFEAENIKHFEVWLDLSAGDPSGLVMKIFSPDQRGQWTSEPKGRGTSSPNHTLYWSGGDSLKTPQVKTWEVAIENWGAGTVGFWAGYNQTDNTDDSHPTPLASIP